MQCYVGKLSGINRLIMFATFISTEIQKINKKFPRTKLSIDILKTRNHHKIIP